MSIAPEPMPGDIERDVWYFELAGNVIPPEDLKRTLVESVGEGTELVTVSRNEDWTVYGYRYKGAGMKLKFAYLCHGGGHLVLGQPRIIDDISIRENIPLAGREGYDIYCGECNRHLDGFTGMMS